ncbi:MAG: xanthine dehydrogenase family protein molybdopterin-binding subunit, partial [Anaerolineales bacterium]
MYSKLVGMRVKRKEDPHLLTGQGTFVANLKLPRMLSVVFIRSPYAHAHLRSIDASAALRRAGVVAVISGEDLKAQYKPVPMASTSEGGASGSQEIPQSHYALSIERVRHVGEAVAAVVATDSAIAADAANEVLVDWEPASPVIDPLKAAEVDAPRVFDELSGNVAHTWKKSHGDVDGAFASAQGVIRQRMVNQRLAGIPLECRAAVAAPDPTTGGITLWTTTQAPHWIRGDLAKTLRMPETQVRVIAPDVGGGFGLKGQIYPEEIALAVMALRLRAPLQWIETRMEHMTATVHGRGQIADIEVAVQADGTVTALRLRVLADLGAYPIAPVIPELTGQMAVGTYRIPAVDIDIRCVYTNTTPVAAYRGAGRPEAAYYIERMMDLIAAELNLDPVAVRRKNFIPPEAFPYKTPTGPLYDTGEYDKALSKALQISNYQLLREEQRQRREANGNWLLGIGLACYTEMCGFGPYESSVVRVNPQGDVTVLTGISPHGQGQQTTFAQIVADELGVDFDRILVRHGDTGETPMGQGTGGSRGLVVGGSALVRALAKIRAKAARIAAHMLEAAPEDIILTNRQFHVKGAPSRGLTLAQIADRAYSDNLPADIDSGLEAIDFFRPPETVYPFGAMVAVVEVDRDTGEIRLREFYSVDD